MANIQVGLHAVVATYTGTGANIPLNVGFVPAHIIGFDASVGVNMFWWNGGMNIATGTTTMGVTSVAGTFATITAGGGGISALDGSAGTGIGVTIGTNTTINITGHGYVVTAWPGN